MDISQVDIDADNVRTSRFKDSLLLLRGCHDLHAEDLDSCTPF